MASRIDWAIRNALIEQINDALDDWYGDAEDWQPSYLAVSPELDEVVINDDISEIPVGWHTFNPCIYLDPATEIADEFFDLR